MYYIYICSHFGSIPIQVETPCDKLGMGKGKLRLRWKPFVNCHNENKKFRHLLAVAYRNWKVLEHINNKVVKKKATSIGASSGPGSAVVGSTCRPAGAKGKMRPRTD